MPRITDKRRAELTEYRKLRKQFLADNPVDEIWLAENGWKPCGFSPVANVGKLYSRGPETMQTVDADYLIDTYGAPRSTEIHHKAKRRGPMLNETQFWLALCRKNHERVESSKSWARANGYLLNF
jgi:hypothetical protein